MPNQTAFHLQYLGHEFEKRQRRNPQYTLRSFARDLASSPSWVSDILNGKKGMSQKKAQKLSSILGLSKKESKIFILSAQSSHARRLLDRKAALEKMKQLAESDITSLRINSKDFHPFSAWYYQALLELTELRNFDHSIQAIARKLRLPLRIAHEAIEKLVTAGLLKIQNGKMKAVYQESETDYDIPSSAIKEYHQQVLNLAGKALYEQDTKNREFINMTLAFDIEKIAEAKEFIRDFQKQFAEKFYSAETKKNSVYQFSTQLFRLDIQEEDHEN